MTRKEFKAKYNVEIRRIRDILAPFDEIKGFTHDMDFCAEVFCNAARLGRPAVGSDDDYIVVAQRAVGTDEQWAARHAEYIALEDVELPN